MSYLHAYADEAEEYSEHNYVVRHWRGYLPLATSYWVNGGILFAVTGLVGNLLIQAAAGTSSLQSIAASSVAVILLLIVLRVWSLVGIWRSARRHVARGGSPFWAGAAQVMVVLGALGSIAQAGNLSLQLRELGQLALGSDPLGEPAHVSVSGDGREIVVEGNLAQGVASRFSEVASRAQAAERVVLSSRGGRIHEAELIAAAVRERGLATHVRDTCYSACTVVLLAGRTRTAALEAQVGFHRAAFPGLDAEADQAMNDRMARYYRRAGLPPYFLRRIDATRAEEMWFPTAAELMDAEILSDARPQLEAALRTAANEARANLPQRVDEVTTLQQVTADGDALTFRYRIDATASAANRAQLETEMTRELRVQVCQNQAAVELLTLGGRFVYSYTARNGANLGEVTISYCDGPNRFRLTRT